MKTKHKAYIAIGSNLNDPMHQVQLALKALYRLPKSHLMAVSRFYQSEPISDIPQPDYINAVVLVETGLSAHDLLTALEKIEQKQGRERTHNRWESRTIDLDLILFDNLSINTPRLIVPHPEFQKRAFVLLPLAEVAPPDFILPSGKKLADLIHALPKQTLAVINFQETDDVNT